MARISASGARSGISLLSHEGISVVDGRRERLLDRAGADPAGQVQLRTSLVVRPGGAGAAERLLADDGAGGFVVDVEIAGGLSERGLRLADGRAIAGEHGAGQRVRRRAIDEL